MSAGAGDGMSDTSTSGDTGQARSEPCIREGATPAGLHDPDDPQPDTLIIDCRAHGEIGRVSFGPCEFERAEALFAEHVADTGQARERVARWIELHTTRGSNTERLSCSYEDAPLTLTDIRALLATDTTPAVAS